eukprot:CAMPEP_0184707214 /NCGR_PEP_ID=MMETSP0313-20130426/37158_1 /TAXON_ID=2792 /ORGANISM="Porphyridium aerugineum, Strain SAG 1380-2" /LENGTH=784 /DNA_ID=CAMNT_0027168789 /DNA_START=184 /DNA_END=2538 /DNA_ORIENTATION=-
MRNTLIAYDGSGSTGGMVFYHERTQRILQEFPKAEVLLWDDKKKIVTRREMAKINEMHQGGGGTDSAQIADYVKANDFKGHLIIITDGEVYGQCVDRCSEILGNEWPFREVTCHLIGGSVNMSVTCPFTRVSPHTIYLYEPSKSYEQQLQTRISAEDLAVLDQIKKVNTVDEFMKVADLLERVLIARTMGTGGHGQLRDELLDMKKRLISKISAEQGKSDAVVDLKAALSQGNVDNAVTAAKKLTTEYYMSMEDDVSGGTWSSKISRMIAMCEGALRGVFSLSNITAGISADRVRRAGTATAPAQVAPTESNVGVFQCPVTMDEEKDVVLLIKAADAPILADVDKAIVNDILDCPLNLFKYEELVEKFIARLDHLLSLSAYRAAQDTLTLSPMTRAPLMTGAICFGEAADHAQATTCVLANMFTGGKLTGNADFWYACLYLILAAGKVQYLKDVVPFAEAHMKFRLNNHSSYICLSGLPEFPTTRVPLGVAIWYVLSSPLLGMPPDRDVVRGHLPHLNQLLELNSLTGYQLPAGLDAHYARLRLMLRFLGWIKKDRYTLPMLVSMLHQANISVSFENVNENTKTVSTRVLSWIPIDGPPTEEAMQTARKELHADLDSATVVGIATLVNPSLSAGDIAIPFEWTAPALPAPLVDWKYGLKTLQKPEVTIVPATCRPQYQIGNETWKEQSERMHGPVTEQLSVHAMFGRFVVHYTFYPSRDDLLIYIYNRCVVYGKHRTLPAQVMQFVDNTINDHQEIIASIAPDEFAKRWKASVEITERIRLEQQ